MQNTSGPDTIFYTIKLKRTKSPLEVFEKMQKSVKKKGATKNWTCNIDSEKQVMTIDFGDEKSEVFCLSFDEKKICDSFCKVYFPIEGELFDNEKKSEFKILLNMIWSARSMFSKMEITDDYGIATDFLESKKYKLALRELTEEELALAEELYDSGLTKHPDFILAVVFKGLEMDMSEKWQEHVNKNISFAESNLADETMCMWPFFMTYVYETAEYKNNRVMNDPDYDMEFSGLWFSIHAFALIVDEIYRFRDYFNHDSNNSFGVKHAQIRRVYKDKVYPQLDTMPDGFEKCCLAYRFFLSAYDFCGFKYVGMDKENTSRYKYL